MHKTFGDRGKEETPRLRKTGNANEKVKILQNVTLVKARAQDETKSDARSNKRNVRREGDEDDDISETQSFLNYCSRYIIKSHNSSFSSPAVSDDDNGDNKVMGFPDGRETRASRLRRKKHFKSRNSSSDWSRSISNSRRGSKKRYDQIDQAKKKEELIVRNTSSKRIQCRNFLSGDSDNCKSNKTSRLPGHDRKRKLVERNRDSKRHKRSSSSSPVAGDSESGRNEDIYTAQAQRKRKLYYEKSRSYKGDSSTDSSVSNDKENEASRFFRGNRNSPESGRNKVRADEVINKSFRKKLDFDSDSNSSTTRPSCLSKRLRSFSKTSSNDDVDMKAVPTNKRTKAPINDTTKSNKSKISSKFSDESSVFSCSSDEKEFSNIWENFPAMDESVRHRRVTEFLRKWCPCNEDVDVLTHIECAKSKSIHVGGTLENIILNNGREWEVDLSLYQQRKDKREAKSSLNAAAIKTARPSRLSKTLHRSFNKTLSNGGDCVKAIPTIKKAKASLNDTKKNWQAIDSFFSDESSVFSCGSDEKEFSNIVASFPVMDESVRHQRVTEFLRKWYPCNKDVDVLTHLESAKSKSIHVGGSLENIILNTSDFYGRELEVDLGLYRQKKNEGKAKTLPDTAAISGGSVNLRLKENNKHELNSSDFINGGWRALVIENKEDSTRILRGRKIEPPRQLNYKSQKSQQDHNLPEISEVNGGRDEALQGRKKQLRQRNKTRPQISKANGEGEAEELQRKEKELPLGNKHLDESCRECNNSAASKSKANGEGKKEFEGIKTRLRLHNKLGPLNLQSKPNGLEMSKANGEEGKAEELQGRKKELRLGNKHLDASCCENNNSAASKSKANDEGEKDFEGIKTRLRLHNSSGPQNLQSKDNGLEISKANGEDGEAEELQRREKELRVGNKHLDESCCGNNNSTASKFKANGDGEKEFEGIKTRLRLHNKSGPQNLQSKSNGLEIPKANVEEGEAEELQGRKKELRLGNKHCCENNNSAESKTKPHGEGEKDFEGIKTRLRRRTKTSGDVCQPQEPLQEDKDTYTSKANGGSQEELRGKKKRPRQRSKKSDVICKPQKSREEGKELESSKGNGKVTHSKAVN